MSTIDERIAALEKRIGDLEREVRRGRDISMPPIKLSPPLTVPAAPAAPFFPPALNRCVKCGINIDGVMSFCCQNYPCPTGLGGTFCGDVSTP